MINLIITGIVLLFLLFGFLWGFIRGLKKTTLRGGWLILTAILCLLIAPLISQLICNINISGLNININGTVATNIKEAITLALSSALSATNLESLPMLTSLTDKLPIIILSPFVFVILFWLLKIILLPFNAILAKVLFGKKKNKKENSKSQTLGNELLNKKEAKATVKKYRLYGGLVGIVVGLIVCCATFVPVFGVLNIAKELNETQITVTTESENTTSTLNAENSNQTSTKEMSLLEYLLGDKVSYYNEIESSVGINILKYTGVQGISSMQFTTLTTTTINNTKVSLSSDVKSALSISNDLQTISNFNANNLTKESLSTVINSTISILNKSKQITLLQIVSQEDISQICDEVLNNPDSPISLPYISDDFTNSLVRTAIGSLSNYNMSHIIDDAISLINIVKSANDNDVLIPIINNEIKNENETVSFIASISDKFYNDVIDNLFNIDIINSIIPMSADYGIKELCNYLDIENTEETIKDIDIIKQFAKNVVKDTKNILKEFDLDSKYVINENAIKLVGNLLDDITKNYSTETSKYVISPTLKTKLLEKAEDKLIDKLNENDNQDLNNVLTPIIKNLSNINDFISEFNKLGEVFKYSKPYLDFATNEPTLDKACDLDITNLGIALDILDTTTIVNNKTYTLYNYVLEKYVKKSTFNNVPLENLATHLKLSDNNTISYEVELTKLTDLYKQAVDIVRKNDINNLLESEEIKVLGKNLQTLKVKNNLQTTDSLFDVDTLVIDLLEIVSNMNIDEDMKQVIIDTRTEIINTQDKSTIDYEVEFTHIYNAMQTLKNSNTNTINDYLDVADAIVNGTNELKASTILSRPIYNLIDKNIPNSDKYSELFIKTIINTLKANIETKSQQVDAKNEINNFIKLFNQLDNLENLNENDNDFEQKLAEISNVVEYINTNSILLTNLKTETISQLFSIVKDNVTNNDLKTALDTAKEDATNSQQTIYQIYQDIKSLKDEYSDLSYSEDDLTDTTLSQINSKLKSTVNLLSFSSKTTNEIYSLIIDSIKNDATKKIDDTDKSALTQDKIDELETFKQELISLIENEKTALSSVTDTEVNNNYYLTSLTRIKAKIYSKPTF